LLLGFFSSCESDQLSEETTDMVKVTIQITGVGEVTPNLSSFPIKSEVTFKAIPKAIILIVGRVHENFINITTKTNKIYNVMKITIIKTS